MTLNSTLTQDERRINEGASGVYTGTLRVKESGAALPIASIDTLTITLTEHKTGEVINSRQDQDCKNTNNVTVDSNGLLTWLIQPEDNEIVSDDTEIDEYEDHRALFKVVATDGSVGVLEVRIDVLNLGGTPATS